MKKALLIGLAVCLGVALAAPAMAIDWSATGYIAIGYLLHKNQPQGHPGAGFAPSLGSVVTLPDPAAWPVAIPAMPGGVPAGTFAGSPTAGGSLHDDWNDASSYVHTRAHLKLTARASEDLYGVFHFEMDSTTWGESRAVDVGGNAIGRWGTDQVAVEVKNLYIDFRVPPKLPIWIRAGMQTFFVRPGWFFVRDGAGVSARIVFDPIKLMIRPMWAHEAENQIWQADDMDLYGFDASIPIGPVTVGGFFLFENQQDVTTRGVAFNQGTSDGSEVWWLGCYADGKFGPVKFRVDFAYDQGEWDRAMPNQDVDFQGWGINGTVDATFGIFNVGLGGLYYSGGDGRDYTLSATDKDYDWFIRPGGSEATGTLDESVIFGGWVSWHGPGVGHMNQPFQWNQTIWGTPAGYNASMAGIWGIRVFASVQPLSWLKLFTQIGYWGDTTDNGDTYGSRYNPVAGWYEDHDEIGWEFDFGAHVNIYKNLMLKTAFGYLFGGSAIEQWHPVAGPRAVGGYNEDPSDPWAWHSCLVYTF
jgi:hypothetical protein